MSSLSCKNVKIQDPTGTLVSTLSYDGTNINIDKPVIAPTAAAGTNTMQLATTGFVVGEKGGRRNYIINGNFDKWDYATSQTSSGYGSDNRWSNENAGSTKTVSQQTCGDPERALFNAMYYSRTVVNSVAGAGNYTDKIQKIENVNLLAGKTVTLSFWAKADANKNIAVEFLQNFGTGGSPSATVMGIGAQLIALTTSWQKKTITVTLPSIVGKTLGTDGVQTTYTFLLFWFDAGTNFVTRSANLGQQSGTFDIAQVKIEDGSVATNGWHPYDGEFGGETRACERYYQVIGGSAADSVGFAAYAANANEVYYTTIGYRTEMRINPSSIVSTFAVSNSSQPSVITSTNSLRFTITATAAGRAAVRSDTTTKPIQLLAEL